MPPIGTLMIGTLSFLETLRKFNVQLSYHRLDVVDHHHDAIRKRFLRYQEVHKINFSDLLEELDVLCIYESKFGLLFTSDYADFIQERRESLNERLVERLRSCKQMLYPIGAVYFEQENLADVATRCAYMREQIIKSSTAVGLKLIEVVELAMSGNTELARVKLAQVEMLLIKSLQGLST